MDTTYKELYRRKYKNCKSKKDYKRLCKLMIDQFDTIDKVDEYQSEIFSQILGEDIYTEVLALAIKMCILDYQGVPYELGYIDDEF